MKIYVVYIMSIPRIFNKDTLNIMKLRGLIRPEDRSSENTQTETPSTIRVTYTDTHVIFEKDQIHDWEVKLYNPEYFRLIGFPDAEISIVKAADEDELVGGGGEGTVGEIHGPFQYFSYFMRPLKSNEPRASEMAPKDEPKPNLPYYENFSVFMNSVFDRLTGKTPILEKDKEPEKPAEPEKIVTEPEKHVEKVEPEAPVEPEKIVTEPEENIEPEAPEKPVKPVEKAEIEEPVEKEELEEPLEKESTDKMISESEPVENMTTSANPVGQESGVRSRGKRMVWRVKMELLEKKLGEKEKEEAKKRSEMKEEKAIKRVKGRMKGEWYEVGERMLRIGEVEEVSVECIYEYEESKYKLAGTLMEQLSGKRVKLRF